MARLGHAAIMATSQACMVCACVDIGTNTTRVLVADVDGRPLTEMLQQRAFTRIGKG